MENNINKQTLFSYAQADLGLSSEHNYTHRSHNNHSLHVSILQHSHRRSPHLEDDDNNDDNEHQHKHTAAADIEESILVGKVILETGLPHHGCGVGAVV